MPTRNENFARKYREAVEQGKKEKEKEKREKKEKLKKKKEFKCRLCGYTEYKNIQQNNGIRGPGWHSWTIHYSCKGCGIYFSDPDLFSAPSSRS